jgi:cell division protein FtsX
MATPPIRNNAYTSRDQKIKELQEQLDKERLLNLLRPHMGDVVAVLVLMAAWKPQLRGQLKEAMRQLPPTVRELWLQNLESGVWKEHK